MVGTKPKSMLQSTNMIYFHFTLNLRSHQQQHWISISHDTGLWVIFKGLQLFIAMAHGMLGKWSSYAISSTKLIYLYSTLF